MSGWEGIERCTSLRNELILGKGTHEEVIVSCARHLCVDGGMLMEERRE